MNFNLSGNYALGRDIDAEYHQELEQRRRLCTHWHTDGSRRLLQFQISFKGQFDGNYKTINGLLHQFTHKKGCGSILLCFVWEHQKCDPANSTLPAAQPLVDRRAFRCRHERAID